MKAAVPAAVTPAMKRRRDSADEVGSAQHAQAGPWRPLNFNTVICFLSLRDRKAPLCGRDVAYAALRRRFSGSKAGYDGNCSRRYFGGWKGTAANHTDRFACTIR
jgi:hypothetical protein